MVSAIIYTAVFVAITTLPLVYYHTELHGFHVLQAWLVMSNQS